MTSFLETKCQVQSATLTSRSKCCFAKFNFDQVVNEDQNSCVDATASSWEILVDSDWQQDETATVTCARSFHASSLYNFIIALSLYLILSPSSSCCSGFILSSTGGIASTYPEVRAVCFYKCCWRWLLEMFPFINVVGDVCWRCSLL